MKNTFKITTADGKTYQKESRQRVLNIEDGRQVKREGESDSACQIITHDIHYSFFEQLTLQISPQILSLSKMELSDSLLISCVDRVFVLKDRLFYMLIFSSGKPLPFILNMWIKFYADSPSPDFSKEDQWHFELCNEEESKQCDILRFGRKVYDFWATELNDFLEGKDAAYYDVEQDTYDDCCNYPDVTVQCHMKKRVDEALKNKIFGIVEDYVSLWNSNAEHSDKIHYTCLNENIEDDRVISIFIDFGNCDPIALANLLEYLYQANSKIKRITLM